MTTDPLLIRWKSLSISAGICCFVLCVWLIVPSAASAATDDKWVDGMEIQSGSLMGLAHISAINRVGAHELKAGIGYTPKFDYQDEMWLASARYGYDGKTRIDLPIQGWSFKPWYFGVGILYGDDRRLFTQLPDQYPSGYYKPTSIRILFNYQARFQQAQSPWEWYFDITVIDVGFINYVRQTEFFVDNYEFLGLSGITNVGFGARYRF